MGDPPESLNGGPNRGPRLEGLAETLIGPPRPSRRSVSVKSSRPKSIRPKAAGASSRSTSQPPVSHHTDSLFSQVVSVKQNPQGICVVADPSRDASLTVWGKDTLRDRYLLPGETYQDLFTRVALAYGDDDAHAQRLYDYMSRLWFMPATPILSNGGTGRGFPISCFLNEAEDSLTGISDLWQENVWLAARGGGIGSYWGNLRAVGEAVGEVGKTSGVIPFIKVSDSMTLAISQGSLRRGSAAVYLPVWHPEIEEFIELRRATGGDPNRRSLNLHHGVVITDDFMRAVAGDTMFSLLSPKDERVIKQVQARALWVRLLTARIEMGEPYLLFIDHVNRNVPEHQKQLGLQVKTSNLCSEITLPTGPDHLGELRTAVCCLSSVNLEYFDQWRQDTLFIQDIFRFLDNVLTDFIEHAPAAFGKATYAAKRERSVGLGVMGLHALYQQKSLPFESLAAKLLNQQIFSHLRAQADQASQDLARERGSCPDAEEKGVLERFSHKLAVAPTATISLIAGESSPGIEPYPANGYTHKTLTGSRPIRNKYLTRLLETKGFDTEDVWTSISVHQGSVQHLSFLTPEEKAVFKTAFEIDQRALLDQAADRAPYICQSQSLNLFLPSDVDKGLVHQLHYEAWKKGLKSLYYVRSLARKRVETLAPTLVHTPASTESSAGASVAAPVSPVSPVSSSVLGDHGTPHDNPNDNTEPTLLDDCIYCT